MTAAAGEPKRVYGARYDDALAFASAAHRGQVRKGNGAPYVTHVIAVSSLAGEYGGDEDQVVAALLHDVVEDCGVTLAELGSRFGERVARIVEVGTDFTPPSARGAGPPMANVEKPPWRPRKEAHVAKVRRAPADAKLVVAADKLHNVQSIARDLRRATVGEAVWARFKVGREDSLWYFRAMAAALRDGYAHEIVDELDAEVARVAERASGR